MTLDLSRLDRAFNPRCVAVVGDSRRNDFRWLKADSQFKGKLYSVQINPETVAEINAMGIPNYPSLLDIPDEVDLAIVAVPREAVLRVVDDCIRKGVTAVHIFAAGFAETGTPEGLKLDRQLVEKANKANLYLIGPNCLGIFNPGLGIRQGEEQYTGTSGPVGFIAQSGNLTSSFSLEAHLQGVDINKSVSLGNGMVLDSTDFLEYFGQDPGIKVIGMYLEGVKDGRRFLKVLKQVATRKPVLVWKGGRTEAGQRAIGSHTGSLAIPRVVWETAVRQCGALTIAGMEEMIDTMKALLYLPPVTGDRVGAAGGSGGWSVTVADLFSEAGLKVPMLTRKSYDELATFFVLIGGGCGNPMDTGGNVNGREMSRIMQILARDDNVDNLVLFVATRPGRHFNEQQIKDDLAILSDIKKMTSKPLLTLVHCSTPEAEVESRHVILQFQGAGIPAFPSVSRGAKALRNALEYYRVNDEIV
ncbi:MAG: CoA-binding protein [Chloroflexi bacterium]|nr:CoA-binding protein [Chloroflexota bacterium]